jgi:hypothetical protein
MMQKKLFRPWRSCLGFFSVANIPPPTLYRQNIGSTLLPLLRWLLRSHLFHGLKRHKLTDHDGGAAV